MSITKEFVQSVRGRLEKQPDIDFGELARALGASEAEVITALPVAMRVKARTTAFDAIWGTLARWDSQGAIFCGKHKRRLPFKDGLALKLLKQGELKLNSVGEECSFPHMREALTYIWFISREKSRGCEYSVCFLDKSGEHLFSVILDELESGKPVPQQEQDFLEMKKRFGVIPTPKNRCKGCKGCTCQQEAAASGTRYLYRADSL